MPDPVHTLFQPSVLAVDTLGTCGWLMNAKQWTCGCAIHVGDFGVIHVWMPNRICPGNYKPGRCTSVEPQRRHMKCSMILVYMLLALGGRWCNHRWSTSHRVVLLAAIFRVFVHHFLGIALVLWAGVMMICGYEMYTHGQ